MLMPRDTGHELTTGGDNELDRPIHTEPERVRREGREDRGDRPCNRSAD